MSRNFKANAADEIFIRKRLKCAQRDILKSEASANERLFILAQPFGAAKCAAHIGMSGERYFKTCREAGVVLKHGLRHRLGKILNANRLKAAEYIGRLPDRALGSQASARHTHRSPSHKKNARTA